MVWIKCKTGEFLDPKQIRSISVLPCAGCPGEVEIYAEYGFDRFLLFRTTLESLQKIGIRDNQEKFREILEKISRRHEETHCITYEDIFSMILGKKEEAADWEPGTCKFTKKNDETSGS